jgi:hypothetical protein
MNFTRTNRKIRELERHFLMMTTSKTVDEFEDNFSAFLAAGRSVTLALQKDSKSNTKFKSWYTNKQNEMSNDELCKYFFNRRNVDLHTGDSNVGSIYQIPGPVVLSAKKGQSLIITNRGVYDVKNSKTPHEDRAQRFLGDGKEFAQVYFTNPPSKHKGQLIINATPIFLCELYLKYLKQLVMEAKGIQ